MADTDETRKVHDTSWSANLEGPRHAGDRETIVAEAVDAVERTVPGVHVNLVTHGEAGHPEEYLFDAIEEAFGDAVDAAFVDRCGCGGYVTRVQVGPGADRGAVDGASAEG